MSERVATVRAKWVGCGILWVALMVVVAVSSWVYETRGGVNPLGGLGHIAIFWVPIIAGLSFLFEFRDHRRLASRPPTSRLPRSFRKKRHWHGPQDMSWWVFIGLVVVCSIGGMLWVPDSRLILIGAVVLLVNLGSQLGDIAFLSTQDDHA